MQISNEQVSNVISQSARARAEAERAPAAPPVASVEELAAKYGVRMDEVRRFTERTLQGEEDVARQRRLAELERRLESGAYRVESEDLVDMAERRAIADTAGGL